MRGLDIFNATAVTRLVLVFPANSSAKIAPNPARVIMKSGLSDHFAGSIYRESHKTGCYFAIARGMSDHAA
jgi:hypothetical protein